MLVLKSVVNDDRVRRLERSVLDEIGQFLSLDFSLSSFNK